MHVRSFAAATGLMMASCATDQDRNARTETVSIVRDPCSGFCPVYELAIASDGGVGFKTLRNTQPLGARWHRVDASVAASIFMDLEAYRPALGTSADVPCISRVAGQSIYTIRWMKWRQPVTRLTMDSGCRSRRAAALLTLLDSLPARTGMADATGQVTRDTETRD